MPSLWISLAGRDIASTIRARSLVCRPGCSSLRTVMDNSGDLGAWEATTFDLSSACFFLGWGRSQVKRELGVGCNVQNSTLPSKDVVGIGRTHNPTRLGSPCGLEAPQLQLPLPCQPSERCQPETIHAICRAPLPRQQESPVPCPSLSTFA